MFEKPTVTPLCSHMMECIARDKHNPGTTCLSCPNKPITSYYARQTRADTGIKPNKHTPYIPHWSDGKEDYIV